MTSALVRIPSCTKQSTGCTSSPCRQNHLQSITALSIFIIWNHKCNLTPLKVVRAHLGSWDSNHFEWHGVPWWAQLSLCAMQTDRKASQGRGYSMSPKFFHVNYQIISWQSKSLSSLRTHSRQAISTIFVKGRTENKIPVLFAAWFLVQGECFHRLNTRVS